MKPKTTDIKPLFEISVYLLCGCSSFLLALAEGSVFPAGFTLPVALLAWYFNEHGQKCRLSVPWMNALGLAAFGVAALEFFSQNIEARLLAGAHLIVYIAWIVFFQEKRPRQFWWLCALGVLQVAVASVLTDRLYFGVLLLCYLSLGVWTLSVFSLYVSQQLVRSSGANGFVSSRRPKAGDGSVLALALPGASGSSLNVSAGLRHPFEILTGQTSRTYGTIQHDAREAWVGRRFVVGVFVTSVLSLSVASLFFALIPRLWITRWPAFHDVPEGGLKPLTGFTAEVRLGDIGEILESTEPVLEVRLFDDQTNERLDVASHATRWGFEEPIFRGAVLAAYQEGRWWTDADEEGPMAVMRFGSQPTFNGPVVRQEIELAPIGTRTLFVVQPALACRLHHRERSAYISLVNSVLRRNDRISPVQPLHYTVYSPRDPDPQHSHRLHEVPTPVAQRLRFRHLGSYLQLPDNLDRLRQLARQVAARHLDAQDGGVGAARALESYLRDSGLFAYSLDLSIDDPRIDPVEDFVFNRKRGHCEYSASALALMMRSIGIPARLVSGFKGGTSNAADQSYVVEQRHAHVWVEAFVAGTWETFDATPEARALSVQSMQTPLTRWQDFTHLATNFWFTNIVAITLQQQQRFLFDPLRDGAATTWQAVRNAGRQAAERAKELRGASVRWSVGLVVTIVFLTIVTLSVLDWIVRRVLRSETRFPNLLIWLARLFSMRSGAASARDRPNVEFYERFQRIVAGYGFQRRPSQTPREFAIHVQRDLAQRLIDVDLADFPSQLVDRFYDIRFGAARLAADEASRIDRSLERLETCLRAPSHAV